MAKGGSLFAERDGFFRACLSGYVTQPYRREPLTASLVTIVISRDCHYSLRRAVLSKVMSRGRDILSRQPR